ncbi:hypothetical protein AVEN_35586-1 [Araneus ventricosus]|uniref:Tc1-like transposase DDE domain-containing protein n=1 Tax=Araneus ventricosus TaxID=182803 RepID=A0A4Y2CL02_ARAVE|nr:hypothetical protein AVEN_35586-1 [Araneus ventricosus]
MTAARYIADALILHFCLLCAVVRYNFLFMDDNAPYHRSNAVQNFQDSKDVYRLMWPARLPLSESHKQCMRCPGTTSWCLPISSIKQVGSHPNSE